MSSSTGYDPNESYQAGAKALDQRTIEMGKQHGLSRRQRELNALWSRYRTSHYDARKVAWDGSEAFDSSMTEQITSEGIIPPGYSDPSGSMLPLRFRKPSVPYHLFRVIVDRFTSLIFSERRHPQIKIEGLPDVEMFVRALADTARIWPAMMKARAYSGAMGTVAVGFQFLNSKPTIEVHDPRWLFPDFSDRFTLRLNKLEKRLQYPQEVQNEKGEWVTELIWYRRVIDSVSDTTYKPVLVSDEEPVWEPDPAATYIHNYGFCPVVWCQNLPVDDDIDGAPDCEGAMDVMDSLDCILSSANQGVTRNTDPTLVISADGEMGEGVKTGSDNVIKMQASGKASYLEVSGQSLSTSISMATELRRIILEVTQCVLEGGANAPAAKTATEIERTYSAMLAKGAMLREQLGEGLVSPLLQMMLKALMVLGQPGGAGQGVRDGGQMVMLRAGLRLVNWKGQKDIASGLAIIPPLPKDTDITLVWPEFFEPDLNDVSAATTATALAKTSGLIDAEAATAFVAPLYKVEDPAAMAAKIRAEEAQQNADLAAQSIAGLNASPKPGKPAPEFAGGFPPKPQPGTAGALPHSPVAKPPPVGG